MHREQPLAGSFVPSFIHSLIHSFNKYYFSTSWRPHAILQTRATAVKTHIRSLPLSCCPGPHVTRLWSLHPIGHSQILQGLLVAKSNCRFWSLISQNLLPTPNKHCFLLTPSSISALSDIPPPSPSLWLLVLYLTNIDILSSALFPETDAYRLKTPKYGSFPQ